jgi:uncharacterized protein involved in exopolysaccharide biosynthesis
MTGQSESGRASWPTATSLLAALLHRRRLLLAFALTAAAAAAAVEQMRPDTYSARVSLFLAQQQQQDPRLGALAAQLPLPGLSAQPDAKLVGAILGSRTLRDSLQARHGPLVLRVQQPPDGVIEVEVRHRDPEAAAAAANAAFELINVLAVSAGSDAIRRRQEFLSVRLAEAGENLARAEADLVGFQRTHNAPEFEEQARQTIQAAVALQNRIVEKEIEVAQLRRVATPDNPELRAAQAELAAWRGQLARMRQGSAGAVLVPLEQSADMRAEAYRLARTYEAHEQLFLSLGTALASAQIEGNRNLPVVTVIDPAQVPTQPVNASLAVVALLAALVALALAAFWVLVAELWRFARRAYPDSPVFPAIDATLADLTRPFRRRRTQQPTHAMEGDT